MKSKRIVFIAAVCLMNLVLCSIPTLAASRNTKIPVRAERVCESVNGVKIHGYSEGMYVISDQNGLFGFVDNNWNDTIRPQYDFAQSFHDGIAVVKQNGKYGCIK